MSIRETVASRDLLWNLTLRELRTRYRRSVLGWTWSMLNPLATMAVYSVVFIYIFGAPRPVGDPSGLTNYPLYLMAGLLPWNFFAITVGISMDSIIANAGLVKKVYFPREILIVSTGLSMIVSLGIEMSLLMVVFLIAGNMVLPWLVPLVAVLALLAVFTLGLGLALAALNVFYRDIRYLWGIVNQIWFYLTPIIWSTQNDVPEWLEAAASWQPMGSYVVAIHNLVYDLRWPSALRWVHMIVCAAVMLAVGQWIFARREPRFAEEM
jgi:ABC-type polysaccharide/polyol phosphate export permease